MGQDDSQSANYAEILRKNRENFKPTVAPEQHNIVAELPGQLALFAQRNMGRLGNTPLVQQGVDAAINLGNSNNQYSSSGTKIQHDLHSKADGLLDAEVNTGHGLVHFKANKMDSDGVAAAVQIKF